MLKAPIIIIGTGLSGYLLAKEFRKYDQETSLLLFTMDDGRYYSKPQLSTALIQEKALNSLTISARAAMEQQLNATVHSYSTVTNIEPSIKKIEVTGPGPAHEKRRYDYSKLIIACGAQKLQGRWGGNAAESVFSVNNLLDYEQFRAQLHAGDRVAIIGSGLVGCEFANELMATGYGVQVISLDEYPLANLIPERAGRALEQVFSLQGVQWHWQQKVTAIETDAASATFSVHLSDTVVSADLVLCAIGLRSAVALAARAGLATHQGIVTDVYCQTSEADVYALGDCAEVNGYNLLHIAPLLQCMRALARTLSGTPTAVHYPVMPIVVKTPACPVTVCPPPPLCKGEWQFSGEAPHLQGLFYDEQGILRGYVLTGSMQGQRAKLNTQLMDLF